MSDVSSFWTITTVASIAAAIGIIAVMYISRRSSRTGKALKLRQHAIESSINAVLIARYGAADHPVEYVNPAFERMTGYSGEEISGRDMSHFFVPEADPSAVSEIRQAIENRRQARTTIQCQRKDGSVFWIDLQIAPVTDDNGRITHFVAVLNDVTETKNYQYQLEHQANFDLLTELPNRNLLNDRLQQAVALARRNKHIVAVALIDLDNFNFVNDSLGHQGGDEVLKLLAHRIRSCVRTTDTVARLASDEFVLVLTGIANEDNIPKVLQRVVDAISSRPQVTDTLKKVLKTVSQPIILNDREMDITCSIGVSLFPHDGQETSELLKHAEFAMKRSKELGRDNFQFYTEELNSRLGDRLALQTSLRRALERDEFLLHFQPKIDLKQWRVIGAEALLRWNSPERGMVSPGEFIATLEDSGLIIDVGRWIIEHAVAQYAAWRAEDPSAPRVAVNVSQIQLIQKDFVPMLTEIVRQNGGQACGLDIEITESLIMKDVEENVRKLKAIRELGVGVSIDDFGTGYSSFSYLATLPVDALKIDRSFVVHMVENAEHRHIVSTIISLAHLLRHKVVAEGVDSAEQLRILRDFGCDEIQGFYFSKPLTGPDFEDWRQRFENEPRAHAARKV